MQARSFRADIDSAEPNATAVSGQEFKATHWFCRTKCNSSFRPNIGFTEQNATANVVSAKKKNK